MKKFNINKTLKSVFFIVFIIIILVIPYLVFADGAVGRLKSVGEKAGYNIETQETSLAMTAGKIINVFLSLLGVIFVILIILAGYNWMTAAGDEAKVTKAKETIRRAIIGFIIIASAFAINNYIFGKIFDNI